MELARNNHRWFALQVKPRQEFSTAKLLRDKGYEEFLPSYRQVRQWSDRQKVFEAPLFAGYVFCRFEAGLSAPLVTTPGVIRIVGSARGATPIEESEIAAIQAITRHGFKATPYPYARVGDKVRITNGPLAGIEGVLKADKNQHHFILTVECVQSSIAVEVSCTNIELVPAA